MSIGDTPRSSDRAAGNASGEEARERASEREKERELVKGLKDTFPASDPVSVTRAARNEPVLRIDENNEPTVVDEDEEGSDLDKAREIGFASEAGNR